MGKYTSNDNRSMQLNPNNERYWSVRDFDDDFDDDYYLSDYDHESWVKERDINRKSSIDELSFEYSGKKVLFKDTAFQDSLDPVVSNFDYLSENIIKENLLLTKEFNIKRSDLRSFLLKNVPSKKFEMRHNWFMRNIVEEDGGVKGKYEYLFLQMFESQNYIIFKFEKYFQGCWSMLNDLENPKRWMFLDFEKDIWTYHPDNIVNSLEEVFK